MSYKMLRILLLFMPFACSFTVVAQSVVTLQWAKGIGNELAIGGNLDVSDITVDGSGNRYVTGFFNGAADFDPGAGIVSLTSAGSTDIFLAKYDASGNYLWAIRIGAGSNEWGRALALDGSGNVLLTGNIGGTSAIDFDPGSGTANLTGAGSNDIFLAKYNSSGAYVWAFRMGGTGTESGRALALDGSGNVLLTGNIDGTSAIDFDPSSGGTANLTGAGGTDIFLAKYDASGAYVWANRMGGTSADVGNSLALMAAGMCC